MHHAAVGHLLSQMDPSEPAQQRGTAARVRKIAIFAAAVVVTYALIVLDARAASPIPQVPVASGEKGYVLHEIRDRLYWLSDGAYNTMFVVSSDGVIAVDPLPTLGGNYLKAIAEVTDKPVTRVIYSHEHTDHIGAAYLFPKAATIIAQKETAQLLATRNDPRRPLPTVTFDDSYTLTVGDQTLVLDYKGVNHEAGNIFIYAPKQRVLMLVDVVYPGYMPYPNLGIAVDVPGYLKAHRDALSYDFDTLVAGHVDRLGTRKDVELSLAFATDLQRTAGQLLAATPFPAYMSEHAAENKWFAHDAYEKELVDRCYAALLPKWQTQLGGAQMALKSQCWSMIVALVVQMPPGD
ncbi:MAG TPA: MBL fold metallo-hydrolase [Casimicrobiaceae bacterium]|nr:MBL fold metallo-hydrolase [Casimicrobiaceae bacterium]